MRLILVHPAWASISCRECQSYIYDSEGKPTTRAGHKVPRPNGVATPCYKCPKIPDSEVDKKYYNACELTEQLWRTYRHYKECRAIGSFPDDPIVRRNAAIIREIEDAVQNSKNNALFNYFTKKI